MKKLALILLAAVSLIGTVGLASAQYGGGYYGPGPDYGERYRQRYYSDDDRYYRRRYSQGRGYRTWNGCPPNWTIQDGRCKPYRG